MMNLGISLNVKDSNITPQYKKELLIRKSIGKKILSNYIEKVISLFDVKKDSITLLGLYDSDNIFFNKEYVKKYNITIEKKYSLSNYDSLHENLSEDLKLKDFIVFLDYEWKKCGAIILGKKYNLNIEFGLGKNQVNNEIHFISTDQKTRILLDYTHSDYNSFIEYIKYESID